MQYVLCIPFSKFFLFSFLCSSGGCYGSAAKWCSHWPFSLVGLLPGVYWHICQTGSKKDFERTILYLGCFNGELEFTILIVIQMYI